MRRLAAMGLMALGVSGCPGFGDKTLAEIEGIDEVPTYHQDIAPIMTRYCTACHNDPPVAGAPQPLITFSQVQADADRIRVRCVQLGDMPPGGGVDDTDKAIIEAWVAGGTPEGEADAPAPDQGVSEPEPDLGVAADMGMGAPTWATIEPILTANACSVPGCHGGASPAVGLDLTSYAGFIAGGASGGVFVDGDPAASLLIDRLRARNGQTLMPPGPTPIPDDQIATFEAWIEAGVPE